jgi:hypothetical protein
LLDLVLVQTIAQRSVHQGLGQCTTPSSKTTPNPACS